MASCAIWMQCVLSPSERMSGYVTGGCDKETRGQASIDRSAMERDKTVNKPDYSTYSKTIHCQTTSSDCPKQSAVKPILGKYSK